MPADEMIAIILNGEKVKLKAPAYVIDAISHLKPASTYVAAELNGVILEKLEFEKILLQNNDSLEIIQPLGGGSR